MGKRGPKARFEKALVVRMNQVEFEELQERAKEAKLSVSRYLVAAGMGPVKEVSKENRELQERAIFHVRMVGVNLNQVAKVLNKGGYVSKPALERVLEEQAAVLRALREASGGK